LVICTTVVSDPEAWADTATFAEMIERLELAAIGREPE
jgi:hypothetical protein